MAQRGEKKPSADWKPRRRHYQDETVEKAPAGPYDGLSDVLPHGYTGTPRPELARGVAPARQRRIRQRVHGRRG